MKKLKMFVLVLVTMFGGVCLAGCSKGLDVTKDMQVEFSGLNTEGTAEVVFPNSDYGYGFVSDLITSGKLQIKDLNGLAKAGSIENCVTYTVTPDEGLSNGDTVTVNVSVDSKKLKSLGYSAKSTSKEFKVEGLKEGKTIDAFKDYEIKYDGVAPDLDISQDSFHGKVDGVSVEYRFSKEENLNVGDEITVTAVNYTGQPILFKNKTKKFKVDNVDRFVMDVSDITDTTWNNLKKETDSYWKEHTDYLDFYTYKSFDYVGYCFYGISEDVLDEVSSGKYPAWHGNECYLVYKVTMQDTDGDLFSYYTYYEYEAITTHPDGTQSAKYGDLTGHPGSTTRVEHDDIGECGFYDLDSLMENIGKAKYEAFQLQTDLK